MYCPILSFDVDTCIYAAVLVPEKHGKILKARPRSRPHLGVGATVYEAAHDNTISVHPLPVANLVIDFTYSARKET